MKSSSLSVCVLLLLSQTLFSQTSLKQIKIGDQVPDIKIKSIINYKATEAAISSFKGKLLILDFWATWCAPCLAAFPKLDSLQKKFSNDIQILSVTAEKKELVKDFLRRMSAIKNVTPPSVTDDKTLTDLFSPTSLPHYVWIDKTGKVVAITESINVNENTIKKYLQTQQIDFASKPAQDRFVIEPAGDFTLFAPSILIKDNDSSKLERIPFDDIISTSVITKYVDGLASGARFIDSTHVYANNVAIVQLYRVAFFGNNTKVFNQKSFVIDIPDSTTYYKVTTLRKSSGMEMRNWIKDNGYCYELKVPAQLSTKRFDIMLDELNQFFGVLLGIEGKMEERNSKYLALVRTSQKDIKTAGGEPAEMQDKIRLKLINRPLDALIQKLALPLQKQPLVINETNYQENVDLELNGNLSDLNALNGELAKYGLQLIEKEKIMPVGVIKLRSTAL